jgi:hypothetical protein
LAENPQEVAENIDSVLRQVQALKRLPLVASRVAAPVHGHVPEEGQLWVTEVIAAVESPDEGRRVVAAAG